jgi:hypothetical protein
MYIEKPNKIEVRNATTNPPIQNKRLGFGTAFIPSIMINCLPLSKVVELQKQLSNAPVTMKKHISMIPTAEAIAVNFPSHLQTFAPAVQQVRDRD